MPPSRRNVKDNESDVLSSISDGPLSEPYPSIGHSTSSHCDEPKSPSISSASIRPRSTTSGIWQYGHKKIDNGVIKRHGKNAIWECDDCRKELSNTGAAKQHLWYTHKITVDGYTGETSEVVKQRKRRRIEGPGSIEAGFARSESISAGLRAQQNKELLYDVINQQELHDRVVKLVTMRNLPY
ncbi:hypothetical protein GGR58DRAFT_490189 [Xylaria digitata]|nr:hypothetical protein GGR58DRAFT_490189 [Xylaria digitata]